MDEDTKRHLHEFYDILYNNLERERKPKNNSIILSFLEMRGNSRNEIMNISVRNFPNIDKHSLDLLLTEGLIQTSSDINSFIITSKGVWVVEKEKGIIDEEILLNYINDKYFIKKDKSITDKEKVVLFSMMSARAFSEKSAVDLNKNRSVLDRWKSIIDASSEKLSSLGYVSKEKVTDLYGKSGNEHVVSGLFRRNTGLPGKTNWIYKYTGEKKYYLDIYDGSEIYREKLSYLFWIIFEGNVSSQKRDEIINFCNEISANMSIFVFDSTEHLFSMPVCDILVKDCLMDSIISKKKWENRT
ncbi:hypothetical protein [Methanosarcina mazei]|uniref:DUF4007 domain-containing protein n=1 Tax=Methanosarcina mazei TaxID=2209 RepID=A0A0F8HIE7_METMZ|nr:hypothetical protein [Methanosarcina mazei]KKG53863.1 hypothetical protein DU33_04835 [Methanosarcina mazei]KKG60143.1 hypothetical protein DU45_13595 [Methanosarcina mazei]KKG66609.1 hypothetical protein DU64_14605 [Methanosarcina mazei]KKG95577.1 hypothetical protein DU66_09895 [Methanosarcina mazei]KKH01402.1 hypothetical protein DU56_10440 [Methanosarcina mazei]